MESSNQHSAPIAEIDVLWITAGLGCDGDTIAMTAATQPSIEDIVRGGMPWTPKVTSSQPVSCSSRTATISCAPSTRRRRARSTTSSWSIEGSIPNENNKEEGYWASFGTDAATGQPITTCEWIDRLAPKAWAVIAAGTCATYGGIHAMEGNPTGCMGLARLSRLGMEIEGRHSHRVRARLSRCSRTTSRRRCSICFTWRPVVRR